MVEKKTNAKAKAKPRKKTNKSKVGRAVGGAVGGAVVLGSLVFLHKSGKAEHIGTLVKNKTGYVIDKITGGANKVPDIHAL